MSKFMIKGRERPFSPAKYKLNVKKKAPSKGAQQVKEFLIKHFSHNFLLEEFKIPSTKLRVDFVDYTLKVAYEYHDAKDGHHNEFNPFFHKTRSGFKDSFLRDCKKLDIMMDNGYVYVEIFKEELPLTLDKLREKGVNC